MSDWLMVGVWRGILRLPPGVGQRRLRRFERRAREVVGALTDEQRAVHHDVVRALPLAGEPLSPAAIAARMGLPDERVVAALDELEQRKGFLFRNEAGEVVWAYPITVAPTPHHVRFRSGETLYAA